MELPLVWWAGGDLLRGFLGSSRQVSNNWPRCEDQNIAGSTELASGKLSLSDPSTSSADRGEYLGGPSPCGHHADEAQRQSKLEGGAD
jgi:hypothetical protein